jgi:hypothetical protein
MKPFRLPHLPPRPSGSGAFWDYRVACALRSDAAAAGPPKKRGKPGRRPAEAGEAEQRWDAEGGRTRL